MKHYTSTGILFITLSLWLPSLLGTDYLLQSRIKGTLMAAGLGDAFARTVLDRAERGHVAPVTKFDDLHTDEWVFDSKEFPIGIATENTILGIAECDALAHSRQKNFSLENLVATSKQSLADILKNKDGDPFFHERRIRPKTFETRISSENDPVALVRAIAIGLTFCDDVSTVLTVTNKLIKNSYKNSEVYASCLALAVGIAHLVRGDSVDDSVTAMITAVKTHGESRSVEKYIKRAVKKARKKKAFIGSKLEEDAGSLTGDTSEEVLAAALYCFMRSPDRIKESLRLSVHAQGNNAIIAYITGAFSGAYNGFWGLKKQGYTDDLAKLEKINAVQGTCNDIYILITDYPPYSPVPGFYSRLRRIFFEEGE